MTNFFADYFFIVDYFYRRLNLTDEYSYGHLFFYKREHLVFSNLKIPLFVFSTLNSINTFKT